MIAPNAATAAAWGDKPLAASVRASDPKMIGKGTLTATVDLTVVKWRLVIRGALWCEKAPNGSPSRRGSGPIASSGYIGMAQQYEAIVTNFSRDSYFIKKKVNRKIQGNA